MTTMNARAAQARESARETDGKFGNQPHDRADGIDLHAESQPQVRTSVEARTDYSDASFKLAEVNSRAHNRAVITDLAQTLRRDFPQATYLTKYTEYDDEGQEYPDFEVHDANGEEAERLSTSTDGLLEIARGACDYEGLLLDGDAIAPYAHDEEISTHTDRTSAWSIEKLAAGAPRETQSAEIREQRQLLARMESETRRVAAGFAIEDMVENVKRRHPDAKFVAVMGVKEHGEAYRFETALDAEGRDLYADDEASRLLDLQFVSDDYSIDRDDLESQMASPNPDDVDPERWRAPIHAVHKIS